MRTATATATPAAVSADHFAAADLAPPTAGPLPGLVDLLGAVSDESGRPLPGAFLDLLRHVAACVVAPPPGGEGAGTPPALPGEWVSYFKAGRKIARRLDAGATLIADHGRGGFVLLEDGREVARAGKVADLGLLLAVMDGKPPKGGMRVKLKALLPRVAAVRYSSESLNGFIVAAVRAEVKRRCAAFDAEAAALDQVEVRQ